MPHLETARLTIAPFTLDLLRAARRDPTLVGQRLRLRVPASWPGPDIAAALPAFIRQLEPDPAQDDWSVHLVSHTATRTLIGFAGFNNGPPDATGTVEIGYDVLPAYQRHGYATEATSAILAWFFAQLQGQRIRVNDNMRTTRPSGTEDTVTCSGMRCMESARCLRPDENRAGENASPRLCSTHDASRVVPPITDRAHAVTTNVASSTFAAVTTVTRAVPLAPCATVKVAINRPSDLTSTGPMICCWPDA